MSIETNKQTIRSFFRTRSNEELLRVATSKPERFDFVEAHWTAKGNGRVGCLLCHLSNNHYFDYKKETPGAKRAEHAYNAIRYVPTFAIREERESNAGRVLISLAREILSERSVSDLLEDVSLSACESENEGEETHVEN